MSLSHSQSSAYWFGGLRQKVAFRTILFGLSLFFGCTIYSRVILQSGGFGWDEAAHALRGLLIARDLAQGDWLSFLYDSYRQVYWPPVHSWLTGITFLLGGINTVAARIVSLVSFVMASWGIYVAGLLLRKQNAEMGAAIAAILFISCPSLISFAGKSMLEIPGLLALILAFVVHFKLIQARSSPPAYALLGLTVAATYFVKSNYGVLLCLALLISWLIDAKFRLRLLFTRTHIYTVLPLIIIFSIWFAYPAKLAETWTTMLNRPFGGVEPFTAAGLLFYPSAFFRVLGSVWIGSLLLLSAIVGLRFRQDQNIRLLIVLVLTQVAIGEMHHTKVDRHLFPILPALFLLSGYVLADWWDRSRQNTKIVKFWAPRVTLVFLVLNSANLFITSLKPSSIEHDSQVISYVAGSIRSYESTLIIGSVDLRNPSPPVLDWHLVAEESLLAATQAGASTNWEAVHEFGRRIKDRDLPAWIRDMLLKVLTRADFPAQTRSLYLGLPPYTSYSQSPEGFSAFVEMLADLYSFDSIVAITSLDSEARYPADFIDSSLQQMGFSRASTKNFEFNNVRVDVYRHAT
jgi:hypothetical protein